MFFFVISRIRLSIHAKMRGRMALKIAVLDEAEVNDFEVFVNLQIMKAEALTGQLANSPQH